MDELTKWGLALALGGCAFAAAGQQAAQTPVQRGAYLARAGDCVSCHTTAGGTPYAGGLRMKLPFGNIVSPNITPDPDTGIGTWTADDLYRVLHEGISKKVGHLFPAMPFTFYTRVTREDSDAIFAYLRSLAPVKNAVVADQLRWPFSVRMSMIGWNELFFTEGSFKPDAGQSAEWNRGAYLVEGLGHCSACHSPRNLAGAIEKDKAYTGATIDGWFALNLSSNLQTGLGSWSVDDIATYLKTGALKGKSTVLGPMAEVVHNSLSFMTDADLRAMATYLKTLPANSSLAGRGLVEPVPAQAAVLYVDHCAGCHQAKGRGIPGVFPPLAGNGVTVAPDPANIVKVVLGGVPARGGYIPMPGFASALTDAQIADITNYVRSNWGNKAPTNATPQAVAALRRAMPAPAAAK